jgi:hypothetical protein
VGWYGKIRPVQLKPEVLEPLRSLLDSLADPDLPGEVNPEALEKCEEIFRTPQGACEYFAEALLEAEASLDDEGRLWIGTLHSPDLEVLLPLLGQIAQPGSLIVVEIEDELPAGWTVLEDGSLQELVLGFVDPESGRYWLVE